MSKAVKPCPFCGGIEPEKIMFCDDIIGWLYRLECRTCWLTLTSLESMDDAIKRWNTRLAEYAKDREIENLKSALKQIAEIANRRGHLTVATWQKEAWYELAKIAREALFNTPDTGKME